MIAEHIRKKHGGNSFKKLAAYVLNAKDNGRGSPATWQLAEYVIDSKHGGEKVGHIRITNCESIDPRWAVAECDALSKMNTRSGADRSYHLVVSFPAGERPTEAQLIDIEDEMVKSIGFEDHKRVSATHVNTDNYHLHIAICTVHPTTHRLPSPYRDHYKLQEACIDLELKHGLTRDNHDRGGKGRITERERSNFAMWINLHATDRILRVAKTARGWDDLHAELAKHGLVIKPRGAGLVIAHYRDGRSMVKASDIDRSLAFRPLTERFGSYLPLTQSDAAPEHAYKAVPRTLEAETLWKRFELERDAAKQARELALASLKARHVQYGEAIKAWYAQRHATARAQRLSRADRQQTIRTLIDQSRQDRIERIARERAERDAVKADIQVPTWQEFLDREASRQTIAPPQTSIVSEVKRGHDASVLSEPKDAKRDPSTDHLFREPAGREQGLGR